jgi:hypothetical protein
LVDTNGDSLGDIMLQEGKGRIAEKCFYVVHGARGKVVHTHNAVPLVEQSLAET